MKSFIEEKPILGKLYAGDLEYELLELEPAERFALPTYMRNGALSFHVRDGLGNATYVVVKGDFVLQIYSLPVVKKTGYFIEEEETEKLSVVTNSL